jgi:hypothetical protein
MHIFLSNCWWQESDIWSQASYRYAILWEAFLDPSDSYFLSGSGNLTGPKTLPTIWGTYMKLVTKYQISAINSSWEKCAYMFNVYRNQTCLYWTQMLVSMRFDLDRFLLYYSSKSCTSNYKGRSKNVSSRQNMCVLSLYHIYILRHKFTPALFLYSNPILNQHSIIIS